MTNYVTEEAVKVAARAMDSNFNPDRYPVLAEMFRDYAKAALDSAAPLIAAQALRDAADGVDLSPSYPSPGLSELHNAESAAGVYLRARADRIGLKVR